MSILFWWWNTNSLAPIVLDAWTRLAVTNGSDWSPWGMHMTWGSWGMGMILMVVLVWAAIIVAIIFLIRGWVTAGSPRQHVAEHQQAENFSRPC